MLVVASTTNVRGEDPRLDMVSLMPPNEVGRNQSWVPIFKRNCKKVVVTGDFWHSLVSIRGSLFESTHMTFDEIRVGKSDSDLFRCPIHKVDKVCTLGNKTIVDLTVAIDPTLIQRKESGWTFHVDFPLGFTPMCYSSKTSSLQYLAILFQSLGVMAVDVTPVSYTLIWDIPEKCSVELDLETVAENQYHKLEVLNTTPNTKSMVKVRSEVSSSYATVEVETPEMNTDTMRKFYMSRKRTDYFDLEGVKEETVSYLRKNGILKSGQKVRATTGLLTVVVSGDTKPLEGAENIYVVPDFSISDMDNSQFICLEDESQTNHVIEFDKSESYVKYKDRVYPHGSSFSVINNNTSRTIAVVKGSIILVVEEPTSDFPGGDAAALQVISSGDLVVRDLVMRCSSQVTEKVDGDNTYGRNSFYVYSPDDGTTKECTRVSHGLNDAGDTGSIQVDLLYTNENSDQVMVNTISSDPAKTSITARDSSTEVVTATFDAGGLSFDSDNGNIYFGADKDFRIHYAEASGLDPAMLQIQSLSAGDYLTRFLITAEPP